MLPEPMRRRPLSSVALVLVLALAAAGCTNDSEPSAASSTTSSPSTTSAGSGDRQLDGLLLDTSDLPNGFQVSEGVDDTITSFCLAEDATAGLQASARSIRGFTRTAGGASVIQVAFRFRDDGAVRFVEQAEEILRRCSSVPDQTGLAFEYSPLSADLDGLIGGATDRHASRHGVSVGSASLTVNVAVFQHGDVGQLVAVLGVDLPRADLDGITRTALTAATGKIGQDAEAG